MNIKFQSDYSVNAKGFNAVWKAVSAWSKIYQNRLYSLINKRDIKYFQLRSDSRVSVVCSFVRNTSLGSWSVIKHHQVKVIKSQARVKQESTKSQPKVNQESTKSQPRVKYCFAAILKEVFCISSISNSNVWFLFPRRCNMKKYWRRLDRLQK